jgi:hypothetical protein
MPLREIVFIKKDRSSAGLANDQVEPADVAEISGHDAPAVAVAVGAGEITDVHKITLAIGSANVEKSSFALESAEVVAILDDIPGIIDPPFTQAGIELAWQLDLGPAIIRL